MANSASLAPVRSRPAKGTATTASGRSASNGMEQILEGVLFAYGESISLKKLAEVTQKPIGELALALNSLKENLATRGIKLLNKDSSWQLVANKSASEYIERLVKSEMQAELTPAGLEVMAVVAYRGPVSKSGVESIRGVNSTYALRNLTLRGLIEKNENTKPHSYQISLGALKKFGLNNINELPKYHELKQEVSNIETLIQKS